MRTGTSFRTKIFLCMLFAIVAALSLPALYARLYLDDQLLADAQHQALREAKLTAALLTEYAKSPNMARRVKNLGTVDIRISLMDLQGQVLADSSRQVESLTDLDNHADRPEVQDALAKGSGLSTRFSNTLQSNTIYAAVRTDSGHIVRIAVPYAALEARLQTQINRLGLVGGTAVILALLLAYFLSSRLKRSLAHMVTVVEAISLGKYRRRLHSVPGSEFTALADAVNRMAENIDMHISTVADQKGQLASILETMHEGVLVLDSKGRIRSCNRALADIFPAAPESVGGAVVELIPVPALQEAVEKLLHNPQEIPQSEAQHEPELLEANADQNLPAAPVSQSLHLELAQGRVLNVHLARPLAPTPNLGAVAVFYDISDLVRLERIRRDFVTNVSHELRTPLTAIQGYAETLLHLDDLPADARRFSEIIYKHSSYLGRMVEELLSLARLENGTEPCHLRPTNLHDCVQAGIALCLSALQDKQLQVRVDMPEHLMVMGNHTQLIQVIRNLLENACRYAPAASSITVDGTAQQQNAQLHVCDQGPGIPIHELGRIFERFYRVDKQRSNPQKNATGTAKSGGAICSAGSTGLGLAICKHIVERHHGHIWAESPSQHASTCFTVLLPLA